MNISIISIDPRYEILNRILNENGHESKLASFDTVGNPDALVLPIKSVMSDEELKAIFSSIDDSTLVFSGEPQKINRFFKGKIIDYSADEAFLLENAYITAECALSILMNSFEKILCGSKMLVLGYGRIGEYLSEMLIDLNVDLYVYARREEKKKRAELAGAKTVNLSELGKYKFDAVLNTVPQKIISKEITDSMKDTLFLELASAPGGFEDENASEKARMLPGRMKKESAALAIYKFIDNYFSSCKGG